MNAEAIKKALAVAHLVGAAGIAVFWAGFYTGLTFPRESLEKKIPYFEAYMAFEKSFTVPDLTTATVMTIGAVGILSAPATRRGETLLIAASGGLVFLGMLDVGYDLRNGMYSLGESFSIGLLSVPLVGLLGLTTILFFLLRDRTPPASPPC